MSACGARVCGAGRGCERQRALTSVLATVVRTVIPRLTDLAVLAVGSLPRLQRLAAGGLPRVTDNALFFVAEHAFELQDLHMSFCGGLSLEGVRAVLRRLGRLEQVSLSGVSVMRRRGIRRFSERAPEVRRAVRRAGAADGGFHLRGSTGVRRGKAGDI